MSYYKKLDKYTYAKDYLHNQIVLSCEDFPLSKFNNKLTHLTEDDIRDIDEIIKWKSGAESGVKSVIIKPKFDIQIDSDNFRKNPINILNIACLTMCVLFVILIGAIIIGPLTFADHFQFIILHLIISFFCFGTRYFYIASLIKHNNFFHKVVPYAFRYIDKKRTIPCSKKLLTDFNTDSFVSSYYLKNADFGLLLKINVFYWTILSLLEAQIKSCPDKIYKYYRQSLSDPDCRGVSYFVPTNAFQSTFNYRHPRSESKSIISIKKIIDSIFDNENSYWFLMNIIVPARLDSKIQGNEMYIDLSNLNNFKKHYLNVPDFLGDDKHYRIEYSKLNKIYKVAICTIFPFAITYYPLYFRYYYVKERLKENMYNTLLEDYNSNVQKLYEIESVDLIVEVSNNQIYNNHVGHEWGTENQFNGIELMKNSKNILRYHYGEPIELYTYIAEYDGWNDVSSRNDEYNFTKDDLIKGVEVTVDSYVYENRGRYSGCNSKWVTTYRLKVQHPDEPIYKSIDIETLEVFFHLFDNL